MANPKHLAKLKEGVGAWKRVERSESFLVLEQADQGAGATPPTVFASSAIFSRNPFVTSSITTSETTNLNLVAAENCVTARNSRSNRKSGLLKR